MYPYQTLRRGLSGILVFVNFGCAIGIRVHRLSSLCAGFARFFALTPSSSPTVWERGAARSVFGVLKRQLQRGRKLRFRTP